MRCEIPELKRCFICFPLRYGIVIFGYLNLLFDLLVPTVEAAWTAEADSISDLTVQTMVTYKGVTFFSKVWVLILLYVTDIIFNVVLIIGTHTKRVNLMQIYYYYGIATFFGSIITFLVVELRLFFFYMSILAVSLTFIGLLSHVYLLLLVRSEISKPRYKEDTNQEYENHLNEHHSPNWREPDIV